MISQVRIYFQQALQTQFDLYPLPFIPNHSWLLLEVCIWHTVPRQWDSRLNAQALELSRPKCCPHLTLILENQSPQVLFFFSTIEMGTVFTYPVNCAQETRSEQC